MSECIAGHCCRIVVGVDLGPSGEGALREALQLCRTHPPSELHVTHALDGADPGAQPPQQLADALHARVDALRAHVAPACARSTAGPSVPELVFHVRFGVAADVLQQVAIEAGAQLIVVGTRASDLLEVPLGATADALIELSSVPVLVVRPQRFAGVYGAMTPGRRAPGGAALPWLAGRAELAIRRAERSPAKPARTSAPSAESLRSR